MEELYKDVSLNKPAFCLHLGDLANSGKKESIKKVVDAANKAGLTLYPVPGNHDCDLKDDLSIYSEILPDFINYGFEYKGWQFIGLDTTYGKAWDGTQIKEETLRWLRNYKTQLSPSKPTVLFTHFPFDSAVPNALKDGNVILKELKGFDLQMVLSGHHHGMTVKTRKHTTFFTQPCASRVASNHDGSTEKGYCLFSCSKDGYWNKIFVEFSV